MLMRSKYVFYFLIFIVVAGCARGPLSLRFGDENSERNPTQPSPQKPISNEAIVGFQQVNDQVFVKNCQGCHSGNNQPQLLKYSDYRLHSAEIFQAVVVRKTMPPRSAISENDIALVAKWIQQGSPEFGTVIGPTPTPTPIPTDPPTEKMTFENLKSSFFEVRCMKCHRPPSADEEKPRRPLKDFSTFDLVVDNVGSIFNAAVTKSSMPPGPDEDSVGEDNPNRLSDNEKDMLYRWIRDGMIEK